MPIVALTVFAASLLLYFRTLLPGLDLGDTASFQTIVSFPTVNARHAYPLYFGLGKVWIWLTSAEPAPALNRLSAVVGAAAAAVAAMAARRLTASDVAAVFGGLLLAGSYTFWSQAVIAEVYTLHVLFVGLTLLAWLRWASRPSLGRFATLCGVYALGFGNHLMMILLAPALIFATMMRAWEEVAVRRMAFSPKAIAVACAAAAAGIFMYGSSFYGTWLQLEPGTAWPDALRTFWFDVTKADWRETIVGTLPRSELEGRAAMTWFDLRQQFGLAGAALGAIGAGWLWRLNRSACLLLATAWIVAVSFAFWYNVGDTHVFFLPAHALFALFAAAGAAALLGEVDVRPAARAALAAALLAYPTWRIADTLPAVDRSQDMRASELCARLVAGLNARNAVFVGDFTWEVHNTLGYCLQQYRPELAVTHSSQVLQHFTPFAEANLATGRDVVLSAAAAERVEAAFGPLFNVHRDRLPSVRPLHSALRAPRDAPYILALLTPLPGAAIDRDGLARAVVELTGARPPDGRYVVIAGLAGSPPSLVRASNRPFRVSTTVGTLKLDVRIESWLPFDTIRRAGFGHVVANGRHAVTIERGATFAILEEGGRARVVHYAGGSFAPVARYVIPAFNKRAAGRSGLN